MKQSLKIGYSFVDLALGGAQIFFTQLITGIASRGHHIFFYNFANEKDQTYNNPDLLEKLCNAGIQVKRQSQLLQCDVIHLDGYHSIRKKIPILFNLNRCVETFNSKYSIRRSAPIYAKYRVAVSKAVQKYLPLQSKVIYMGFPLIQETSKGMCYYDVAILGRIHPIKNHLLFLEVCEILFQRFGSLRVLMIGGFAPDDNYRQMIESQVSRLVKMGIEIVITGDLSPDSVSEYIVQAKVLLITSKDEGFGRMAVEATACKTPVIANPVGGLVEIIENEKNGLFVERDNPVSFANKTELLLRNEDIRLEMGEIGYQIVQTKFSFENMLTIYEDLYREVSKK